MPQLSGAVNDAKAFRQFLLASRASDAPSGVSHEQGLGVPTANIELLLDKQASRTEILRKFKTHLLENRNIPKHGATMLLYFAGHGGRAELKDNQQSRDGRVETIFPVDERTGDEPESKAVRSYWSWALDRFRGRSKQSTYVYGIPDYVLGQLLYTLAKKKGDNIVGGLRSFY